MYLDLLVLGLADDFPPSISDMRNLIPHVLAFVCFVSFKCVDHVLLGPVKTR